MGRDGSKKRVFRLTAFGGVLGVVTDGAAAPLPETEPCPRETLDLLLEENRAYSPRLSGTLSNHLSMASEALAALGASKERLLEFSARYRRKLIPMKIEIGDDSGSDWRGAVGDPRSYPRLVAAFTKRLLACGRDALLREVLPVLCEGPATEAFHGMIRTAFAVRFEDDRDLPFSLAYWAAYLERLSAPLFSGCRSLLPLEIFAACRAPRDSRRKTGVAGIMRAMRIASQRPEFLEYAGAVSAADLFLEKTADAAIRLYLASGSLTALHAVTGCHAFRLLRPWMERGNAAERHLFRALLAAYLAAGAPPIDASLPPKSCVDWRTIAQKAVAADDEHDVKFAFSCREEERAWGGHLYRTAAARRLGFRVSESSEM